ncbi:polysaccharide pyruvyl transferase family protein [Pontiellaceae bacterium B1224]|nr:polysaccharide pyruvyl transferase family protein [Pontiellaceae bacterium B1224]
MNEARKTVAIITFHSWINGNLNYGATLQAYALCKAVEGMGHSVELIDYVPEVIHAGSLPKTVYRKLFRSAISYKLPRAKREGFKAFLKNNCHLGEKQYRSLQALRDEPPRSEVYMVGSDQVWNTRIFHGTLYPAFFLDFGPENKRRVSYASSFGTQEPDVEHKDQMGALLRCFSAVSVREKSGVKIAEDLMGNSTDIISVLDPTLLLEDYAPIAKSMGTEGTLLAYLFDPTQEEIATLRETAKKLSVEPSLIWDERLPRFEGIKLVECHSPADWVGAMKGAEAVVTNSFHGTVFSILFQHPFVSLLAESKGVENRNTRLTDLAEKLGLDEQLTLRSDDDTWRELLSRKIDWKMVGGKLSAERKASLAFLHHAIDSENIGEGEPW